MWSDFQIVTPHACARGKVIGSVVILIMDTKLAKSKDLYLGIIYIL